MTKPEYNHNDRAGNQGDVFKHVALTAATLALIEESDRDCFRYADLFAGFAWNPLSKSKEWSRGVGNLPQDCSQIANPDVLKWIESYSLIGIDESNNYPGSSRIVADLCRLKKQSFHMTLWDYSREPFLSLEAEYGGADHDIHMESAMPNEVAVQNADFILIDPPNTTVWNSIIKPTFEQRTTKQAVLAWLPIMASPQKDVSTAKEDKASIACLDEALKLGLDATKIRWYRGGRTIGCLLIYSLSDSAKRRLRSSVDAIWKALPWWNNELPEIACNHF